MRKILSLLIGLVLLIAVVAFLAWTNRTSVAAHFLSRHLHAPADIDVLNITKSEIQIASLWIGTPQGSKTKTSFSAQEALVDMDVPKAFADPLIIDEIAISNIFVGVEYYKNGGTNWSYMLQTKDPRASGKKGRNYLIKTLVLENLTVEVVQAGGKKKRYPTIARMEFHNISNETGFPIQEIEKAIFNLMMKDILNKFNLLNPNNTPLKYLPGLFK